MQEWITILSVASVIVVAVSNTLWTRKTVQAKDAHIELLREQNKQLDRLTPIRIREYYESNLKTLEEMLSKEAKEKEVIQAELAKSKSEKTKDLAKITQLEKRLATVEARAALISTELTNLHDVINNQPELLPLSYNIPLSNSINFVSIPGRPYFGYEQCLGHGSYEWFEKENQSLDSDNE